MMQEEIKARKSEHNWGASEKDYLKELVGCHIELIENKQNDIRMIKRKRAVWEAIRMDMIAAGFDYDVPTIKHQWTRMKISEMKAAAKVRRSNVATGNVAQIPVVDEGDKQIQSMIACDFEEDTILTDSNAPTSPSCNRAITKAEVRVEESDAAHSSALPTGSARKESLSKLRSLPNKNASKVDVIKQRQDQIAKEYAYDDELHLLSVQQLKAEIAHQARMHLREEELIDLKCQLVRLQIRNEESKSN